MALVAALACGRPEAPAGSGEPPAAETAPGNPGAEPAAPRAALPGDVPAYPGARPTATVRAPGRGLIAAFRADDPPEQIARFYREMLAGHGWKVHARAGLDERLLLRAAKAGRRTEVAITGAGGSTQIMITIERGG